jgi:SynChlorMet cassette radical SAM/SPASM protein ScmE
MRVFSAPSIVSLNITSRCNLHCWHCCASNVSTDNDLSTQEILDIIAQMQALKVFSVGIFGAEPLLHEDLFVILEALAESRIRIYLNTNGTLITRKLAQRLARTPIKKYVVSLDGSCSAIQDGVRGSGSFEKSLKGIRHLLDENCNVTASTTITRANYRDLKSIITLGKRLGVTKVVFNDLLCVGNAQKDFDVLCIPLEDRMPLLHTLQDLKRKFKGFVDGGSFDASCGVSKIDGTGSMKRTFPLKIGPCSAAMTKCSIRPDGWVTPCEFLWDVKAGNLRKQSLYDIWHHSPVMKQFRELFTIQKKQIPKCAGCHYLQICYDGHRCRPYYYPEKFKRLDAYCLRPNQQN